MHNTTPIETSITLCDIDITIRQELPAHPTMMWGDMRYQHTIKIIIVGEWPEYFKYYGSVSDYRAQTDVLSESDLVGALECIMSDAIIGTLDCMEFFKQLDYENPCEGLKVWRGCIKSLHMLNELGISNDMLCDMSNELEEYITSRSDKNDRIR